MASSRFTKRLAEALVSDRLFVDPNIDLEHANTQFTDYNVH